MSRAPTARRNHGCPLCRKPAAEAYAPFCSQGCRDRDLLNWLGDGYRVPGPPAEATPEQSAGDGLDSEG